MLIAKALAKRLEEIGGDTGELLETLLFEIPEEALETFHNMADPVEIDVDPRIEGLMEEVADAFGMNVLGLSVLMNKIIDKTAAVAARLDACEEP